MRSIMTAFVLVALALADVGCSGSPLQDGTYYVKNGKVGTMPDGPFYITGGVPGTLPDGVYKVDAGKMLQYDPVTGKTAPVAPVPVNDPTTSLWGIIAAGVGSMVVMRLVGVVSAKVPFLAPIAPLLTGLFGGSGFRPSVITEAKMHPPSSEGGGAPS